MAELRTVEKSFDVGILSVSGSILSLPDEYVVIPHLLYASRKLEDYVISVIGPNGFFLLSYQPFFDTNFKRDHIEDAIIYLREYMVRLNEYLSIRHIRLNSEPKLIIAVENSFSDIQGDPDDVLIVPVNKIKKVITSIKNDSAFSRSKIQEIVYSIRANGMLSRINQYQPLTEIEYTETYSTYLAYDTVMDRSVAIKEIRNYTDVSVIEDLEKNEILREAKLTMQLKHKNIINIEQIIPKDSSLYIIIEWLDKAKTLRQLINQNKSGLDPDLVRIIIIQICEALEHAHSKGIVHRNIRPENILITDDYLLKITNFDLAKKLDISTRSTFDLKQMIKENPYAAPEFRLGSEGHHNIDQRVDIYATGVILYELLTNRLPSHLDERYWDPPSNFNQRVTEELDRIALKSMRFDPHQRFGTISALKDRLINLGKELSDVSPEQRYIERQIYKRTRNSIIYQAYDNKLKRKVAIKKILLDTLLTTDQRKQKLKALLSEAYIVSKLSHENIVSVFDYFIEDDDGYIVMEWLEGKTLREIRNEISDFSIEDVIDIGIQIGNALNYAHQQNIMHKDIKPENIIFNNKKITILDFGLAGFLEEKTDDSAYGTAMYMAPEQLNGVWSLDQRVDIFSLGVLIYELLTKGKYPYDPSIIMSKYAKENVIDPILPSEINFVCPATLDKCIIKALKVSPDERYQRISDFIYDLHAVLNKNHKKETKDLKNNIISFINKPKAIIFMFLFLAFLFTVFKMIQKEKKESLEMNNVVVSVPAIPSGVSFDSKNTSDNDNWISDAYTIEGVKVEAGLKINKTLNQSTVLLKIYNNTSDELIFLNRIDQPDLLDIKDDLGNSYNSKVAFKTVSSELTRIYPKTKAEGSFIFEAAPPTNAKYITISLSESEKKKISFFITLRKK